MKNYTKGLSLAYLLLCSFFLHAQQHNIGGIIEGFVKDVQTGESLPYASVFLLGTNIGTITDEKGFYQLKGIKSGEYDVRGSFIGYTDTIFTVRIKEGTKLVKDISLVFGSALQGVVITAQASGQVRAINTQVTSRTILNVVSEAKIKELPDANAAEALSRLPGISINRSGGEATSVKIRGVSSNSIYVNGMQMGGSLGSISSSMIGSIEVSKAFMPDQDANVLGGSVEFKMREATPGFKSEILFRQGYNDFTKSFKMQDAYALFSNRFFNNKLGVMLSLSYDRKDRSSDSYSAGIKTIGSSNTGSAVDILPVYIENLNMSTSHNLNNRYGITAYTDYKLKYGKIYYQGFYSLFDQESKVYNQDMRNSSHVDYSTNLGNTRQNIFMNGIGGDFKFSGIKVDLGIYYTNQKDDSPENIDFGAENTNGLSMGGVDLTTITTIDKFLSYSTNDINFTTINRISQYNQQAFANEFSTKLNVEVPFRLGKIIDGYFKFGGRIRTIDQGLTHDELSGAFSGTSYDKLWVKAVELYPDNYWPLVKNGIGLAPLLGDQEYAEFHSLNANIYYPVDAGKLKELNSIMNSYYTPILTSTKNNMSSNQNVYAAYFMAGINIGKMITFTPGVRFEQQQITTNAKWLIENMTYGPIENQGEIHDVEGTSTVKSFLPMIHFKFKPLEWFDIRLAYTKTLGRPDAYDLSPRFYRTLGFNITQGNLDLIPQYNTNYDMYFSVYRKKMGLFTFGLFYKKMENQILSNSINILDPKIYGLNDAFKNKIIDFPENNAWPGYVKGIEADWQTQFSYLPKPFNGIILNTNITYMISETRYPIYDFRWIYPLPNVNPYKIVEGELSSRTTVMQGSPKWIFNFSLGYEVGGFSGRVSLFYQPLSLNQPDRLAPTLDKALYGFSKLDAQFSYKIKKVEGLMFYLNLSNLTNTADKIVNNNYRDLVTSEERYGSSGDIGVRFKF
jgi:TonB-dependent receptor